MDAESIAKRFGGQMVFYGGIDVQQLLSYGTPEEVAQRVQDNLHAFAGCGGYIVANSHRIDTIKGENLEVMCRTAASTMLPG
jgi:uroporphyrinogen decarboxylase